MAGLGSTGGSNRRQHPRAPMRRRVLIFRKGDQWQAELLDLSAGGALLETALTLEPGERIAMGLHLDRQLQKECGGLDYLNFTLEVIEAKHPAGGGRLPRYRCRNLTENGSEQQARANAIVYQQLAA